MVLQDVKIALVQMQSKYGEVQSNLHKILQYVQKAAAQKVDIICFPEMCIQGYSREVDLSLAENIQTGKIVALLKQFALDYNIVILAGIAEWGEQEKPFITHLVANADGQCDQYRKVHLGKSEQPFFASGDEIKVFQTAKAKLGIQICWDTHFPEMSTILSLQGAEIIFAPHASPSVVGDRKDIWLKYLPARAYDNSAFLAACNLVGDNGRGHSFCGGCLVLDPKGNILAEDFAGQESMLVVNLDASKLNKIRSRDSKSMASSFYLESRRPELYGSLSELSPIGKS